MMSQAIKKMIHPEEQIKKYFSICNRYIRLKIVILFFKWLFIFIVISGIISLLFLFSPKENSSQTNLSINQVLTGITLFFFLIVTPFIIFFNNFYIRISNEFIFTNKRIIVKKGWIETKIKTIYYDQITDISVDQSLLDRLIKTGTLSISTAGSDGYEAVIRHINQPYEVKNILFEVRDKNKKN